MRRNTVRLLKYLICGVALILGTLLLKQVFGHHGKSVERFVDANDIQRDDKGMIVSVHLHIILYKL